MPSTYTLNTGIEKPGSGEQTGSWDDTVNTNFDIIDRGLNGVTTLTLSGTSSTLTTSDGSLSDGQHKVLVLGGTPSGTHTITVAPSDAQKLYFVQNDSGQTVTFTQGSGGNASVGDTDSAILYCDGGGAGAKVTDLSASFPVASAGSFSDLTVTGTFTVNGGAVTSTATELNLLDGATIALGSVTASAAEVNVLDGYTGTTADLNIVSGADAAGVTSTEFQYLNGVTSAIQTQLDAKLAAAGSTNLSITSTDPRINLYDTDGANVRFYVSGTLLRCYNEAGQHMFYSDSADGDFYAYGNVTAYSDERLKMDIEPIRGALGRVLDMQGVTFTRVDSGKRGTGVIAQDVQAVLPEAVNTDQEGYLSVAYGNLVGVLIEAIRELEQRVAELENASSE